MHVFEFDGIRTFRRGADSGALTQAVAAAVADLERLGLSCVFLADVVGRVRAAGLLGNLKAAAGYQSVSRCFPFEKGGEVWRIEGGSRGGRYEKVKKVVHAPGRLEAFEPSREGQVTLNQRIESKLAELGQWTNIYAMREEAKKYMDGKLGAFEAEVARLAARVAELEKSALS